MNESIARRATVCDNCNAELGEFYPKKHENITVNFPTKNKREDGTESYSSQAACFCNKSCLASYLGRDKSSAIASYTAEAKMVTLCDNCKKPIDTKDKDDKEDAIAATLKGPDGINKQYHFHGEGCLGEFLNGRAKKKAYKSKASITDGAYYSNGAICLDISEARDISSKERNSPKEYFLDEERKSFPVMNCEDVKAAVHAWGRYKGSMSFSQFKSKLTERAHSLGCSLPEKWGENNK